MTPEMLKSRALWRPKIAELPTPCASCPFRVGNDAEFGGVVKRLRDAQGITGPCTKRIVGFARASIMMDTRARGDFACHGTAYDTEMEMRPAAELRQCPGAAKFYKTGELARSCPSR